MTFIQDFFLLVFIVLYKAIYPLFKQPALLTYISILGIMGYAAWWNYKWLKTQPRFLQKGTLNLKVTLRWGLELFLIAFLLWFVLIHFRTVSTLS